MRKGSNTLVWVASCGGMCPCVGWWTHQTLVSTIDVLDTTTKRK